MDLMKKKVTKNDKTYTDLFLCWEYESKTYLVRVRPVFNSDYDKLIANAVPLDEDN